MLAKLGNVRVSGAVAARSLLWLGLLWLHASSLHAQAESGFALQVRAPERSGCVDAAALRAQVEARTGRAARVSDAAVSVDVQIDATAQGYRAVVTFSGSRRELAVEGACSELDEALVVVIASSIGISTTPDPPPPTRDKLTWEMSPPRSAAMPELSHTPPERAASPPAQLDIQAGASMLTGVMPRPAFGVGAALLVHGRALGIRVGATVLPSSAYALQRGLALHALAGWAELGLCGRAAGGERFSALFCADLRAGAVRADVERLRYAAARWDALVMAVPRAEARLKLAASVGVSLGLGAAIPLVFPRYAYGGAQGEAVAAHTPELGVFVELGLWLKILP